MTIGYGGSDGGCIRRPPKRIAWGKGGHGNGNAGSGGQSGGGGGSTGGGSGTRGK